MTGDDEPATFAPIDDILKALASVPGINDNLQERTAARLAWEQDWAKRHK